MKERDEQKSMSEGRLYRPTDTRLILKHVRAIRLSECFSRTRFWNMWRKNHLINRLIPNHGRNCFVTGPFRCEYGFNIKLGDDFYCNFDCLLLDVAKIEIGDGVMLGARVTLATPQHPMLADERKQQQYPDGFYDLEYAKPISIGNNVWIASNVTVTGGVTIGDGAVIGAGSVVTRDIPANCFAAGVPARVIRTLDEDDRIDVWDTYMADAVPLPKRKRGDAPQSK